ncbi:hypothetical protein [Pseudomonas sp. GM67]|uniref:hypothetical protein n=1 Tax=Pseudomonas sp. GM67 TaxID=1144335 RepID=UPI000518505A|nr:hypothetical protein [Pseudomonas sp. GM67]
MQVADEWQRLLVVGKGDNSLADAQRIIVIGGDQGLIALAPFQADAEEASKIKQPIMRNSFTPFASETLARHLIALTLEFRLEL